jgi:hypothetical protein
MRIFFSPDGGDPTLLDTQAGLHALYDKVKAFLISTASSAEFAAHTDRSPEPYKEFLLGLRVTKAQGATRLTLGTDRWLTLEGSPAELAECARQFLINQDDGHTHLHTAPVSLIIEADSTWGAEIAS